MGSIPGSGRLPGGGHGNPHSVFAWRIPMDRGAWRVTVQGVAQSRTRLSDLAHTDRHRTFLEPTKPQGIKYLLAVQYGFCALDIKKSTENKVSAYTQGNGIHFSAERCVESMAFEKTSR